MTNKGDFVPFSETDASRMCKIRNLFAIPVILLLFLTGSFYAETIFTEKWWRNATIQEVVERFDGYSHFSHFDKDGHTLLMYALKYAKDPNIAMYFILNKSSDLSVMDRDGRTAVDYARQNPIMREPYLFLLGKRDEEYIEWSGEND